MGVVPLFDQELMNEIQEVDSRKMKLYKPQGQINTYLRRADSSYNTPAIWCGASKPLNNHPLNDSKPLGPDVPSTSYVNHYKLMNDKSNPHTR